MKRLLLKLTPALVLSAYHYVLAFVSAIFYGHPSREMKVVAVTGTKGKSTVTELIYHILKTSGKRVALANTIHFIINGTEERNMYKMTMPGRFFLQRFLRRVARTKCEWVVLEMTSEGAKQFRHRFVDINAFVFTNLAPEHIESHGSYENYKNAKLSIGRRLEHSSISPTVLVVNGDDKEADSFLNIKADTKKTYSLKETGVENADGNLRITKDGMELNSPLRGEFNAENILAAVTFAQTIGIDDQNISNAVETFESIRGRVEKVEHPNGRKLPFEAYVDYAHTIDSMEKLYQAFNPIDSADTETKNTRPKKLICVFGATGGGRDQWKRKEMGAVADRYCDHIILTNEDPYDEDPRKIIDDVAEGITSQKHEIVIDRREAINKSLRLANDSGSQHSCVVLVTGKGTDPYIMGPKGTKEEWDDAEVVREEMKKLI